MEQDNLIGRTIDKYEILDEIARGGMATVYKARQQTVNRTVAIKVIDAEYAKDPTLMQRFRREVDLIATLQHPHILPVYDYGQIENRPYIVMAFMPGGSVHEPIVAPGHIALETVSRILNQTTDALDHAHREQVIHRDLKPSNILLDKNGNAHLADFGIAKLLSEETGGLTGDRIIGTLSYMAPEMFRKQALTPAIDIYALGVTLYQMLTEETPYKGDTAQVIGAHLHEPIPSVRNKRPDLPEALNDVIRKAMAKYPEDRYPTAGELAADFQRAVRGEKAGGAVIGDKLGGTTASTQPTPKSNLPQPPKQSPPSSSADTLAEGDQWYNASQPEPAYQPPPQYAPQQPNPYYPEPSRSGRRKPKNGGGLPIGVLIGILGLLLVCLLAGGVGAYLYFGGPQQPDQVDSPAQSANGTNIVPTALPTPLPTHLPTATDPDDPTPDATASTADEEAIRQKVIAYDEAMRFVLETGDKSTVGLHSRGDAYQDRIDAIDLIMSAPNGPCFWDFDHEGIDFLALEPQTDTTVRVIANLHRGGQVVCTDGVDDRWTFTGPSTAVYILEYADGQWWVIEFCFYDRCEDEIPGWEE